MFVTSNSRVVSGCDELAVQIVGTTKKRCPLNVRIAQNARIGRSPRKVLGRELVDYPVAKLLTYVDNKVRKIKSHGHTAGVIHGIECAAADLLALSTSGTSIVPRLHGDSDNVVTLLFQHYGGYRGVHSSAHGDKNPTTFRHAN
jgi:hypothetical protein